MDQAGVDPLVLWQAVRHGRLGRRQTFEGAPMTQHFLRRILTHRTCASAWPARMSRWLWRWGGSSMCQCAWQLDVEELTEAFKPRLGPGATTAWRCYCKRASRVNVKVTKARKSRRSWLATTAVPSAVFRRPFRPCSRVPLKEEGTRSIGHKPGYRGEYECESVE